MAQAVQALATQVVAPPETPKPTLASWETHFNTYIVDFISNNACNLRGYCELKAGEATVMKVMKVALAALASFILMPLAVVGCATSKLRGICKKAEMAPQQPAAPPSEGSASTTVVDESQNAK